MGWWKWLMGFLGLRREKEKESLPAKSGLLTPVRQKPRFPCPFYGFFGAMGIFMDQRGNQCPLIISSYSLLLIPSEKRGNQCPLITGSYSPCQMEFRGETPAWDGCPFNKPEIQETLLKFKGETRISPGEFWPEGASSWQGMSFGAWWDYIMDPSTPRPERGPYFKGQKRAPCGHFEPDVIRLRDEKHGDAYMRIYHCQLCRGFCEEVVPADKFDSGGHPDDREYLAHLRRLRFEELMAKKE